MLFMNEIKTQHAAIVKVFRSDIALEYTTPSTFEKYFASQGSIHETFCAHIPQQNGVVERKHHQLLEITSLMLHMFVPKHHWPEAMITACFLINRMPSVSLNNNIPFKLLFPNTPLFRLKPQTFGCICFVHVLPTRKDKPSPNLLSVSSLATHELKKVITIIAQPFRSPLSQWM